MCLLLHSPHTTEVVPSQMQTRNLGHQPESYLCHGVTGPSAGGVPGAWAQGIDWPWTAAPWGWRPAGTAGEEEKKDLSRREQAPDAYGCPAASGPLGTVPPL